MEICPNPFNPNTTISFTLGSSGTARVEIFNLKGQLVKSLWQGNLSSGEHSLAWDATDDGGRALPSGMYLLKLECGANIQIGKLMLMK
jgi:flagellar hook assembly protein FlgD